jgi:four helix bundle protein
MLVESRQSEERGAGARCGAKVSISRKEARETRYWLRLLVHADARLSNSASPLIDESRQLIGILTTIKMNSERDDDRG